MFVLRYNSPKQIDLGGVIMKTVKYSLSQGDVEAISAALSILPAYDFAIGQNAEVLFSLCASAGSKLISHKPLTNQEMGIVALAIDSAYKALRDEISIDEESKSEIREYLFTYNKLLPVFSPLLDM